MEPANEYPNYKLITTCLKNGGFRQYVKLPPQHVFQHVYWVLGSELEVRIKRRQTFFNRETSWMRLPAYLIINKGILIIYVTAEHGYVLRVASALKINFVADKKSIKKKPAEAGPNFAYSAYLSLNYSFGEVHLRFVNESEDNLRSWRTLLIAAHECQDELAKVGRSVAETLRRSTSLESVLSTKSVLPSKENKKEEVMVNRHPCEMTEVSQVFTPSSVEGRALQKSISDVSLPSGLQRSKIASSGSSSSVPSHSGDLSTIPEETHLEDSAKYSQLGFLNKRGWESLGSSTSGTTWNSVLGTSEVDVTFKDLNHNNCSTTSVHTAILYHNDVFFGGEDAADRRDFPKMAEEAQISENAKTQAAEDIKTEFIETHRPFVKQAAEVITLGPSSPPFSWKIRPFSYFTNTPSTMEALIRRKSFSALARRESSLMDATPPQSRCASRPESFVLPRPHSDAHNGARLPVIDETCQKPNIIEPARPEASSINVARPHSSFDADLPQSSLAGFIRQQSARAPTGSFRRSKAMEFWKNKETENVDRKVTFSPVSAPRQVDRQDFHRRRIDPLLTSLYHGAEKSVTSKNAKLASENESHL